MTVQFSIGDVVYLKSGSPEMTVILFEDRTIRTVWFDGNVAREASFPEAALSTVLPKPLGSVPDQFKWYPPKRFIDELPSDNSRVLVYGDNGNPSWGEWDSSHCRWSDEFDQYEETLKSAWWVPVLPEP